MVVNKFFEIEILCGENLKLIMSKFVYDIAVDSIRKTKEFEKEHIVITH